MKRFTFKPYLMVAWAALLMLASAVLFQPTLVLLAGMLGSPIVLALCFLWPNRWNSRCGALCSSVVVALTLVVIVSIALTNWPLRLAYRAARQRLDSIAARVESGQAISSPIRAGLITIRKAEVNRSGVVCLWTDPSPNGHAGFVRTSPGDAAKQFNLFSTLRLDNTWQFIEED